MTTTKVINWANAHKWLNGLNKADKYQAYLTWCEINRFDAIMPEDVDTWEIPQFEHDIDENHLINCVSMNDWRFGVEWQD